MPTKDKLETCPYCGGEATLDSVNLTGKNKEYSAGCLNRDCTINVYTDFYKTKRAAIDAWNRRAEK